MVLIMKKPCFVMQISIFCHFEPSRKGHSASEHPVCRKIKAISRQFTLLRGWTKTFAWVSSNIPNQTDASKRYSKSYRNRTAHFLLAARLASPAAEFQCYRARDDLITVNFSSSRTQLMSAVKNNPRAEAEKKRPL